MDLKEPDLLECASARHSPASAPARSASTPTTRDERVEQRAGREILFRRAVGRVSQPPILMIDVLEHVADDSEAGLREMEVDTDQGGTFPLMTTNAE